MGRAFFSNGSRYTVALVSFTRYKYQPCRGNDLRGNYYTKRRFHYFRAVPGQFYFFEARRTQFSDTLRAIAFALCSFCGTNAAVLRDDELKIFFGGRTSSPFSPPRLSRPLLARKIGMSLLFPRFLLVRFSATSDKNKIYTCANFSFYCTSFCGTNAAI